ncbi:/ / hypothetical protein / 504688:505086 Reverse [Candidatus Hepatoplasma crinochetorum]|uniref:Uncharacterized protein n=1 Tax=Candidatus Hepatoplasma crinochetorum TaxID=295596 RepID=A0A0G7ZLJ4_9MOLU|nr:/ / hypothetical protein / 504688:505086 Reverse [Candidatus Hepatoplasma crinochetorum]
MKKSTIMNMGKTTSTMNYDVLTDQQLLEQLILRKIPFEVGKITREEMLKLLNEDDLKNPNRNTGKTSSTMNYDVLTDQQLLEQLILRKIPFEVGKITREEMLKLLNEDDLKNPNRNIGKTSSTMNYDVLTDQQLLEQLILRKIPFEVGKITREEMLKLLNEDDLKNPNRVQSNFEQYNHQQTFYADEISGAVKAGAILNIIVGCLFSIFIFTLFYTIPCIYLNITLLKGNTKYKTAAGILGLFCSLAGGVLVLVG